MSQSLTTGGSRPPEDELPSTSEEQESRRPSKAEQPWDEARHPHLERQEVKNLDSTASSLQERIVRDSIVSRKTAYSSDSARRVRFDEEPSERESRQFDVDKLINNPVSRVLHTRKSPMVHSTDLEMCLQSLGLGIRDTMAAPPGSIGPSTMFSEVPSSSNRVSLESKQSVNHKTGVSEIDLIHDLFGKEHTRKHIREHLQRHHMSLITVLRQVFWLGGSFGTVSSIPSNGTFASPSRGRRCLQAILGHNNCLDRYSFTKYRKFAKQMVSHCAFQIVFSLLTVYTLYSADAVAFLPMEYDMPFLILNTVVFGLFTCELVITSCGHKGFVLSVPFFLDCLALISLLSDTVMIQGLLSDNQSKIGRLARSARMTRLVRIVRVTRVTRLIPRLLSLLSKNKSSIAQGLVERRLWRIFLFLDTDCDLMITSFDLKWFFVQIVFEFQELLPPFSKRSEVLQADANILALGVALRSSQEVVPLTFVDFQRVYLSTNMGKALVQLHVDDLEQEQSIWTLTAKISDSTALKVCLGIIMLIGAMTTIESSDEDKSAAEGLAHLELASNWIRTEGGVDYGKEMCRKISVYMKNVKVLFLSMGGHWFIDSLRSSSCNSATQIAPNPVDGIRSVFNDGGYRELEVMLCTPGECNVYNNEIGNYSNVIALVSIKDQVLEDARNSMLTTTVVVVMLVVFVFVLNRGVKQFSRTLLQPLRELVDDMQAMSVLELLHIDKDMPRQQEQIQIAEELEHLTQAFKSMKTAIKSWSKYVPNSVVQRLYNAGVEATIGVDTVEATILFCDIDGFEESCAGLLPAEVLRLLNNVLAKIGEVIENNKGTLLEFIGDEVLAVFNTPSELSNHVFAAVSSAVEIHSAVTALPPMVARDMHVIKVRCRLGIHSTSVFAGNIGSQSRMKYGLLGDGVNLTARLKGLNSRYQTGTLISEQVLRNEMVFHHFITRPVDVVAVKGKKEPTTLHEVLMDSSGIEATMLSMAAERHTDGFVLYQKRNFQSAREAFLEVYQTFKEFNRNDEPSRLLAARCEAYIEQPPPEDWDGVDRLKQKSFAPNMEQTAASEPRKILLHEPVPVCSNEDMVRRSRSLGVEEASADLDLKPAEGAEEREDLSKRIFFDPLDDIHQIPKFNTPAHRAVNIEDLQQDVVVDSMSVVVENLEVDSLNVVRDDLDPHSKKYSFCPCG